MSGKSGIAIGVVTTLMLSACYAQQGGYGYGNYSRGQFAAQIPPPPPPPPQIAPPPFIPAAASPVPPTAVPAVVETTSSSSETVGLPTLVLPVHEDWSSQKCPGLAVTFTGHSQPVQNPLAETASFQEARQLRDGSYAEGAECFCAKSGNLSETSQASANIAMNRTARQISEQLHMKVHAITFVENSPLGSYSELEAGGEEPAKLKAMLRVFWRGQCSIRVMALSDPTTETRASEFLQSLHNVVMTEAKANDGEMQAVPTPKVNKSALPAALGASARSLPGAVRTNGPETEETQDESVAAAESSIAEKPAQPAQTAPTAQAASFASASPASDVAMRLRQLQTLQRDGLISKSEYDAKRQAIVDGL